MEVLKGLLPQVGTGPRILSRGEEGPAPDAGDIDQWMLTNMNAEIFLGCIGLKTIAQADGEEAAYIDVFLDVLLRALKGINGFTVKQLERIAIGMGGGVGRKTMKKPGWFGRNVTNRSFQRKADDEGVDVEG